MKTPDFAFPVLAACLLVSVAAAPAPAADTPAGLSWDKPVEINVPTPLMRAAQANSFNAARDLLWAGADASARDAQGHTALDYLPGKADVPLVLLLRCYAYLQTHAHRATARPVRPNLVLIMEDAVNYLHPQLKAAYWVNGAELNGKPGVDDDGNGFVDDVYGWRPETGQPYAITAAQFNAYTRYRDVVARIVQTDTDWYEGRITDDECDRRLAAHTNPYAEIMGPIVGANDGEFLADLKEAAHGSHVAGIVLAASDGRALLHTMVVDFKESSRNPLGQPTKHLIEKASATAGSIEEAIARFRQDLLDRRTEVGRAASRYVQATGAGVANLSFGGGYGDCENFVKWQVRNYIARQRRADPTFSVSDDDIAQLIERTAMELYIAYAADMALVFYENPDVLFVCAAGNDHEDNDKIFQYPAYLSRFFPNVIAVASVDQEGAVSSFTNTGVLSVNVSAPGEKIRSTVIPEASMYMDGTSMAAPYVSGVAALARSLAPDLSAADLRRELEFTVAKTWDLRACTASGGIVDRDAVRALHGGTPRAQSDAYAHMAINTTYFSDVAYPHHLDDAGRFADRAVAVDAANPEALRASAIYYNAVGQPQRAWEIIQQAQKLASTVAIWDVRALVQVHLQNLADAAQSLATEIAGLEKIGANADPARAIRLIWRSQILQRLGRAAEAGQDLAAAHRLLPNAPATLNVESLLF